MDAQFAQSARFLAEAESPASNVSGYVHLYGVPTAEVMLSTGWGRWGMPAPPSHGSCCTIKYLSHTWHHLPGKRKWPCLFLHYMKTLGTQVNVCTGLVSLANINENISKPTVGLRHTHPLTSAESGLESVGTSNAEWGCRCLTVCLTQLQAHKWPAHAKPNNMKAVIRCTFFFSFFSVHQIANQATSQ